PLKSVGGQILPGILEDVRDVPLTCLASALRFARLLELGVLLLEIHSSYERLKILVAERISAVLTDSTSLLTRGASIFGCRLLPVLFGFLLLSSLSSSALFLTLSLLGFSNSSADRTVRTFPSTNAPLHTLDSVVKQF